MYLSGSNFEPWMGPLRSPKDKRKDEELTHEELLQREQEEQEEAIKLVESLSTNAFMQTVARYVQFWEKDTSILQKENKQFRHALAALGCPPAVLAEPSSKPEARPVPTLASEYEFLANSPNQPGDELGLGRDTDGVGIEFHGEGAPLPPVLPGQMGEGAEAPPMMLGTGEMPEMYEDQPLLQVGINGTAWQPQTPEEEMEEWIAKMQQQQAEGEDITSPKKVGNLETEARTTGATDARVRSKIAKLRKAPWNKNKPQSSTAAAPGANVKKKVDPDETLSVQITRHPLFDKVVTLMILLNASAVGVQINHDAVSSGENLFTVVVEYVSIAFFSSEVIVRLFAMRHKPLKDGADKNWFAFDSFLVVVSWIDLLTTVAMEGMASSDGLDQAKKIVRTFRLARIGRLCRLIKTMQQLNMMANLVLSSVKNTFWLFVFLTGIIYLFAIILTHGATQWRKPLNDPGRSSHEDYEDIDGWFGTIPRTMFTLFQSMTGGVDWGDPGAVTQQFGPIYFTVFCIYMFVTIFSVLNIVNGIFVDAAIQKSSRDRDVVSKKMAEEKKNYADSLAEQLDRFDADGSGFVSKDEWEAALKDPDVVEQMESLDVRVHEAEQLFDLLDVNKDGMVTIAEFKVGMEKLRGPAQSVDLMGTISQINAIKMSVKAIEDNMNQNQNPMNALRLGRPGST